MKNRVGRYARGLASAVFCEMQVFSFTLPSWQVLRMGDGRMVSVKDTWPEDAEHSLLRHAKDVHWQ